MGGFFNLTPDWHRHWRGMPEFCQRDLTPHQQLTINFRNSEDREAFARLLGRRLTYRTRSVWYPREQIESIVDKRFRSEPVLHPRWPIFVPSKGRWESCLTMRALERIGVDYRAVVEPQQAKKYAAVLGEDKLLVLPHRDKGLVVTRNWIWDYAEREGHQWFWTIDDNVQGFYRLFNNVKIPVADGAIFQAIENFAARYVNLPICGMSYFMFVRRKYPEPPLVFNSRVYSNMLIRTDAKDAKGRPFRNEGFYNDDTDLCLRVLKDGQCTVQFNAFMVMKSTTMTVKGGMTPHYQGDGRLKMAQELRDKHPDVTTITRKWGRWQHHVDYSPFARNKLKPKGPLDKLPDVDNFGMYLERDADRPVLLVGQAPGPNGDPDAPLAGKVGRRLARLAGVSVDRYLERTERLNLFDEFPGKDGKGDAWDVAEARKRAAALKDRAAGRRVLFAGRRVAAAFGEADLPWLTWKRSARLRADVAVIPHPSGVVRWWNDPGNCEAAGAFLRDLFA